MGVLPISFTQLPAEVNKSLVKIKLLVFLYKSKELAAYILFLKISMYF